jgi:hypothetical protein
VEDRDPVPETEAPDGVAQEGRSAALGIEEDEGGLWPAGGDDEAGDPAPRAEVQQDRRGDAVRPKAAANGDETLGVAQVGVDGAGTEEAGGSGLLEDLAEQRRRRGRGRGLGGFGGLRGEGEGRGGGGGVGAGHRRVRTPGR